MWIVSRWWYVGVGEVFVASPLEVSSDWVQLYPCYVRGVCECGCVGTGRWSVVNFADQPLASTSRWERIVLCGTVLFIIRMWNSGVSDLGTPVHIWFECGLVLVNRTRPIGSPKGRWEDSIKIYLKGQDKRTWNGFMWHRIRTSGGVLWTVGLRSRWGVAWPNK
jgi:hypothetical protein